MYTLLNVLLAVAAAGFCADAVLHIAALTGSGALFQRFAVWLFPVLFVEWIATIFLMNRLTRDVRRRELWKAALRGCPPWMRTTAYVIFGYAWVGVFANTALLGSSSPLATARAASGMMLAFYGVAACVIYSAIHVADLDRVRRCLNGHQLGPLAKYCEECGAPVAAEAANLGQPT